jgi:hypothetical protein
MGLNEEWAAPSAAFGHIPPPLPKPAPPAFTIAGKPVDLATGEWVNPPAPPRPPTSSAGAESVVARAFRIAQNVRDQHEKFVESLKAEAGKYSPDGYRQALAEFDASDLDTSEAEFAQRKAQEEQRLENILEGLAPDGDGASETRRSRYWDGERRRIEASKSPTNEMRKAIAEANPEELAVLVKEIPRELELRGLPRNCLDSSIAAVRPELASAQANLQNLNQAAATLNQTFGSVRRGIAAGAPADPRVLVDPARFDPDR